MSASRKAPISAQVVLRSASGEVIRGDTQLTSETLPRFAPDPETVQRAAAAFARLGFEIGPMVGISFSISAARATFESVFGALPASSGELELALDRLPAGLANELIAVSFSPPVDFGPESAAGS